MYIFEENYKKSYKTVSDIKSIIFPNLWERLQINMFDKVTTIDIQTDDKGMTFRKLSDNIHFQISPHLRVKLPTG